ncbi:MAG: NTF2 fold immunity protein [Flavobacterium sp.]|nr:NTF2 fold immunity protein [Flavobacterium sp.]
MKENFSLKSVIMVLFFIVFCQISFSQNSIEQNKEGRVIAEKELELALSKKSRHNVIDQKSIIIKDTLSAITIAESILFNIYDKTSILEQKPYEIHHINNYWIISGTLPKGYKGGTFLIILDDRNSEIIKLTHGK